MKNFNDNYTSESFFNMRRDNSITGLFGIHGYIMTDAIQESIDACQEAEGIKLNEEIILKGMIFQERASTYLARVGVEIDTMDKSISVYCLDGRPYGDALIQALLADPDVRTMIAEYQEIDREIPYEISVKTITRRRGVSSDQFGITYAIENGGFVTTDTTELCRIYKFGELEKFGNSWNTMKIGDFVEMASFMGLTDDMDVYSLRNKARVRYFMPTLLKDFEDFTTRVTRIL